MEGKEGEGRGEVFVLLVVKLKAGMVEMAVFLEISSFQFQNIFNLTFSEQIIKSANETSSVVLIGFTHNKINKDINQEIG